MHKLTVKKMIAKIFIVSVNTVTKGTVKLGYGAVKNKTPILAT